MKNARIAVKLFSIIGIFAVAFAVMSAYCVHALRDIVVGGEVYQKITRNKDLIADILPPPAFIIESYATAMDILETDDPAAIQALAAKMARLRDDFTARQDFWKQASISAEARNLLTQAAAEPARQFYDTAFTAFLPAATAGDAATARNVFFSRLKPAYETHRAVIDRLAELAGREIVAIEARAGDEISQAAWGVALLAGLLFAAAIAYAITVSRQITRPMGALVHFSRRTAAGELDQPLAIAQRDEIGLLAGHLNDMVGNLRRLIEEARTRSEEARNEAQFAVQCRDEAESAKDSILEKQENMLRVAEQLCDVVAALDHALGLISGQVEASDDGAREQSQRLEETATAMEQMYATVIEVAQNAGLASGSARQAREQAAAGAAVVGDLTHDINGVQVMARTLRDDMGRLGEQAEGIGRIMGVIRDIADQTNLLALNAAIEAARAGEAGRGFAVVADEVRKLAEKTMQATGQVGQAVGGIQTETREHLANVDKAVAGVESATDKARDCGAALSAIVALVTAVDDQVQAIATASEEQSAASEEINRALAGINRISTDTAQAMAGSVAAIEELRDQTGVLNSLIDDMRQHSDALPDQPTAFDRPAAVARIG